MSRIVFLCLYTFFILSNTHARTVDTVYFDAKWKPTQKSNASFYRLAEKKEGTYLVGDYYLTGKLQMEGTFLHDGGYTSIDSGKKHGKFSYYDSAGRLESQGAYVQNKKDGAWKYYHTGSTQVSGEGSYIDGEKDGSWTYYFTHGKVKSRSVYKEGYWNGERQTYDSLTGKLTAIDNYKMGNLDGPATNYFEGTDKIRYTANHKEDVFDGLCTVYDSLTGMKTVEQNFKKGKRHGISIYYSRASGKPMSILTHKDGIVEGTASFYDSLSGNKISNGFFLNDQRDGEWVYYYDDSTRPSYSCYFLNGVEDGYAIRYFPNRNKFSEGTMRDGEHEGVWKFYDSATGKKVTEGSFVKGKRVGTWNYYYPETGKQEGFENYKDGRMDGESIFYYASGKKSKECVYKDNKKSGTCIIYYPNGKVYTDERGKGNKSTLIAYDSSKGKPLVEGSYVNGLKDGNWRRYFAGTDVLSAKEKYNEGLAVGEYETYNPDGTKNVFGAYDAGKRTGKWYFYYPGSGKEWVTMTYDNDLVNGELYSYYENGKVKRHEKYIEGVLTASDCYTEDGDKEEYTPLFTKATFDGEVSTFIGNELKYPPASKSEGVEGRVVVDFVIEEDGRLSDISVSQSLNTECDNEAIRIISTMPKWAPAQVDGKKIKWSTSVPVVFWIHD